MDGSTYNQPWRAPNHQHDTFMSSLKLLKILKTLTHLQQQKSTKAPFCNIWLSYCVIFGALVTGGSKIRFLHGLDMSTIPEKKPPKVHFLSMIM